jgi:hypothetical protein
MRNGNLGQAWRNCHLDIVATVSPNRALKIVAPSESHTVKVACNHKIAQLLVIWPVRKYKTQSRPAFSGLWFMAELQKNAVYIRSICLDSPREFCAHECGMGRVA